MSLPVHLAPDLVGVAAGDRVVLTGDEAHHAVVVRRLRVGERVALTDGRGSWVEAVVEVTGKRELTAVAETVTRVARPEPAVTVVQALPKGDRGELAVEVLTEVGVDVVVPWAASRSVAVWRGERVGKSLAKWRATAREAAKQSRRAWFPEVASLAATADLAGLVEGADLAVVLHEAASAPLASLEVPAAGRIVMVVGPEGGLSDDEVALLSDAGAVDCRLGAEVLRTSTAGVAAVAALLAQTSRWR
ncbi:16S rRNA (uracil(1498)-N(3))-methyltransferase [Nocardioides sp.]|uniref:16S rRNA (uracil(1498)-N(3))-methyltransferase n=1 Tax=Nocardioides sp. TaxID=35761 RepID=UPI00352855AD